jgi:formylglycine-generating enzyme required for sulfatase activity
VGVAFLKDRLSAKTAPAANRTHHLAARKVLESLLPPEGSTIKGARQSRHELLEKSGYEGRLLDFEELLKILDHQLRIITPTTPAQIEPVEPHAETTSDEEKYYQLTHDYLVPSVRKWLIGEKNPAERLLDERTRSWTAQPENRQLPSTLEYLKIWLLADHKGWTEPQKTMMRKAGQVHALHWGGALVTLLLLGVALGFSLRIQQLSAAIDRMASSRGAQVQTDIGILKNIGLPPGWVRYELRKAFSNSKASEAQQLALAYALADFRDCPIDFLVKQINSPEAAELTDIITALGHAADKAKESIKSAGKACDAARDWQYKSRLAIVALHLGTEEPARSMCQPLADSEQRTEFIKLCKSWDGGLTELTQFAETIDDPHLRSALCLGVSDALAQPPPAAESWKPILRKWYQQDPDAGTHSVSGWALRQSKLALPDISPTKRPTKRMDWWYTEPGLTMLKVTAGSFERQNPDKPDAPKHTIDVSEFWISDREITAGQFQGFIDDNKYAKEHAAETPEKWQGALSEYPAQNVNWYDAVMFCNWLSRKLERDTCYNITKKDSSAQGVELEREIELVRGANGFRLPTEAEWEFACRGGTTTSYSFGNDENRLGEYGWFLLISEGQIQPVGSKEPNSWGLFDMHGNVWEWCQDWYASEYYRQSPPKDPPGPTEGEDRVIRGGSFMDGAWFCRSDYRNSSKPIGEGRYLKNLGFRVVTVHPASQ